MKIPEITSKPNDILMINSAGCLISGISSNDGFFLGGCLMNWKQLVQCFLWGVFFILATSVAVTEPGVNFWQIEINIPECCLRLYYGSELWKTYPVAVGKPETPSPQGDLWITVKVSNPTWYPGGGRRPVPAGPANPLGRLWLGLDRKGYGIHGNNQAQTVGLPVSHGCFRMNNADMEELFGLVPVGTPVQITYRPVIGWVDPNQAAFITCYPDFYRQTDRFQEVLKVLQQLGWEYQPHAQALAVLLKHVAVGSMNVPRRIRVTEPSRARDGFSWGESLFVQVFPKDDVAESLLFPGYALIPATGGLTAKYRFDWEPLAGALGMVPLTAGENICEHR
jgi:hypothetical protein